MAVSDSASGGRASTYCIQVRSRLEPGDGASRRLIEGARHAGIAGLAAVQIHPLYFVQGELALAEAARLAGELLADPVTERPILWQLEADAWRPVDGAAQVLPRLDHTVDVTLLPGVTDAAADNLVRAAHLLGLGGVERAATGRRYLLWGALDETDLERLAVELWSNPVIQHHSIDGQFRPPFVAYRPGDGLVETIPLRGADDGRLQRISAERRLALDAAEMRAIRAHYEAEGRDPTDLELETLAQTWSEHCVHKTFKALIHYTGPVGADPRGRPQTRTIDGLLDTFIRRATETAARPWVRSAFVDNAGIIAFDDAWDLAFKVETHNHPSALEPFGGANTGVGGVIRDVLGVSARPIANTDVLCFGPPDLPNDELPGGVLPPARIAAGVVHGIEDYGNKMGIPTVNGAILYQRGYTANPLVYCGCLGILPRGAHPDRARPGDLIAVLGGRTGRDGLRGATFSSMEMDTSTGAIAGSAVQIGNPSQEKQVMEVILQARDEGLYHAITDCGAGGFSSAVGEMGRQLGAEVQLAEAPLKYPGLRPWEIWLSEAQERMVLAVPPENWERLAEISRGHDVTLTCLGRFDDSGRLRIYDGDRLAGDLDLGFLHDGLPRRELQATWRPPTPGEQAGDAPDPAGALLALLAAPDIRSKEDVIRRYDHEVHGATAVKPLTGAADAGPSDAAVLRPLDALWPPPARPDGQPAVVLANGICPGYGALDPYAMAWAAVDEAFRNAVAAGGDPDRVALLDNFCWGNPNLPDRLGSLVRCAEGAHDAAVAFGAPFISGKDSLNNEYTAADGEKHAIPGTLLISAVAIVPDVERVVTMDFKEPGNLLYLLGETRPELGGSQYAAAFGTPPGSGRPPQPVADAPDNLRRLHQAMRAGLVRACHDCSDGGLAVTLAEMALAGRLGAEIELANELPDAVALFAESLARLVVEVRPADADRFEGLFAGRPLARIGRVSAEPTLVILGDGREILSLPVDALEEAWRGSRGAEEQGSSGDVPRAVSPQAAGSWSAGAQRSGGAEERGSGGDVPRTVSPRLGGAGAYRAEASRVIILHANGTNRDREAALACAAAGGAPEIVHVNQLLAGERRLDDYHFLILPGGFSYGDDLGAGSVWALDLRHRLHEDLARFVASGRPVLGICNGFQALVKAGVLGAGEQGNGGAEANGAERAVTLTFNERGRFECRWVYLQPNPTSRCLFTDELDDLIYCPVAHGEGRLAADAAALADLEARGLIALQYAGPNGEAAGYPANPNGSALAIAGLTNAAGNVLGLMPHPEDHIFGWQHPRWTRGERGRLGLPLFQNALRRA